MNINRVIKESIDEVLTEGYSARHIDDQIQKRIQPLMQWVENCRNGNDNRMIVNDEFKVNLKPFYKDNVYMQQKFQKNSKIKVKYIFTPDREYEGGICGRTGSRYNTNLYNIYIELFLGSNITPDSLLQGLRHELTHAIDMRISEWKNSFFGGGNIKYRNHQINDSEYQEIPMELKLLMYVLWDTAEFNAWQSSYGVKGGDFNGFIEKMMGYLEKANSINDPEVWNAVRYYLVNKNALFPPGFIAGGSFGTYGHRDFRRSPLDAVKKYFIDTSFKKLKKFIKKVKL